MSDPYGFYNKYIFNNNSYLKTYLVREAVKNNYKKNNLNDLIDNYLRKNYYSYVKNIKKKANEKISYKKNFCNTGVNTEFLKIIKNKVSNYKGILPNTYNLNKNFNINNSRESIYNIIIKNN